MANEDQIEYWNEKAGPEWVAEQSRLDQTVVIHGQAVLDQAGLAPGQAVLDVGCGTGQSTVAAAKLVGPQDSQGTPGTVLGIDISRVMLDAARKRAQTAGVDVTFEEADAQEHNLGKARFDRILSRFGVMFFDHPKTAFANLHAAAKPGGRLTFVCWQGLAQNPWVSIPAGAIAEVLPLPESDPHAPGPFAFADSGKVNRILEGAGWSNITIEGVQKTIEFGDGDVDSSLDFLLSIGPVASAVRQIEDAALKAQVTAAVRGAVESQVQDGRVSFGSATWLVQATA